VDAGPLPPLHPVQPVGPAHPSGCKGPRQNRAPGPADSKGALACDGVRRGPLREPSSGCQRKGPQTPCAVESAHSNVHSPSPLFGRLGSPAGLDRPFENGLAWNCRNGIARGRLISNAPTLRYCEWPRPVCCSAGRSRWTQWAADGWRGSFRPGRANFGSNRALTQCIVSAMIE
jgi:hypothetical protein